MSTLLGWGVAFSARGGADHRKRIGHSTRVRVKPAVDLLGHVCFRVPLALPPLLGEGGRAGVLDPVSRVSGGYCGIEAALPSPTARAGGLPSSPRMHVFEERMRPRPIPE